MPLIFDAADRDQVLALLEQHQRLSQAIEDFVKRAPDWWRVILTDPRGSAPFEVRLSPQVVRSALQRQLELIAEELAKYQVKIGPKQGPTRVLGPMAEKAKQRPANFESLSASEQWRIDNELGILDWSGSPDE